MSVKVGNDVVDLDEPAIAESHRDPRFLARVCAQSEQRSIAAAVDPKRLLWSLFAAKEAAFKVVCKLGPRPVFAHRKFVVAPDLSAVEYGGLLLPLWIEVGAGWVHALASTAEVKPQSGVGALAVGGDPGVGARELLLKRLGVKGVEVVRDPIPGSWDGFGPPRLSSGDRDISLSHDGGFVAFALA